MDVKGLTHWVHSNPLLLLPWPQVDSFFLYSALHLHLVRPNTSHPSWPLQPQRQQAPPHRSPCLLSFLLVNMTARIQNCGCPTPKLLPPHFKKKKKEETIQPPSVYHSKSKFLNLSIQAFLNLTVRHYQTVSCNQVCNISVPIQLTQAYLILTAQILHSLQTEGLWQACVEPFCRPYFPNSICSLPLCHISVILTLYQTFSYLLWSSVIKDHNSPKAQMTAFLAREYFLQLRYVFF